MNGFEHQVASHMIYEGKPYSDLVQYGLAIDGKVRGVTVNGKNAVFQQKDERVEISFPEMTLLDTNEILKINIT